MSVNELQQAVLEGHIIVGFKAVKRALSQKKIKKIFLSSTCPDGIKSDLKRYAQLSSVDVEDLPQASNEVSLICKKNFLVSVVAC